MADQRSQLDAYKAAASKLESQLDNAETKEDAFGYAINAAESLMKALRWSNNADEKAALKARCNKLMDAADRIKATEHWQPRSPKRSEPVRPSPKHSDIDRWVADVAQLTQARGFDELSSDTLLNSTVSNSAISQDVPSGPRISSTSAETSLRCAGDETVVPTVEASNQKTRRPSTEASPRTVVANRHKEAASPHGSNTGSPYGKTSIAGSAPVRRLTEPVSSRKLTRKEEIILLKSSVVNGFKCPPWGTSPSVTEFAGANKGELFTDSRDLNLSTYQLKFFGGWVRSKHALPPPSMFPTDREGLGPLMRASRTIDLVQDAATDCSVVASLSAAIARGERGLDKLLLDRIWPFDKNLGSPVESPNGKYIIKLNFNGCWRKVVIDDRLPVSNSHRLLHVIDRRNPALLWPALLEKAYLKVRGGYDFPGSSSCSDLWAFTGWIPEQTYLQEADLVPDQLWNRVYKAFLYGDVLLTLGTGKLSSRQERELGLEGQHSYVILDLKETDHDRLLLVKNPWVEGKGWRGARPPSAPTIGASTSSGNKMPSTDVYNRDSTPTKERPRPTTFWIELDMVIRHFESLYLNWNPGLFRYRQDIHFEWAVHDRSVGGNGIVDHPQFSFQSEQGEIVWMVLNRHFRDAPGKPVEESDAFNDGTVQSHSDTAYGDSPKGFMDIYVCGGNGERLYVKEAYLEKGKLVNTPQSLLRWKSEPKTKYTIVVDQDELPASTYTFSLSAFSNSSISLMPATSQYQYKETDTGSWTKHTAGGNTGSPSYYDNPQYVLKVKERSSLAILLTGVRHQHPLHVKLVYGQGKRLYRVNSRDIVVDSGEHKVGCALAKVDDVQPGIYNIICSLFEAGKQGHFDLRVDSTNSIELKRIPRDGAGLVSTKLKSACFAPDVRKIAAPLRPMRLASYTIVARFMRATTPRSHSLAQVARSPLRLSVELGRGPERRFIIASEDGEYADSATVRSESFDLDPGLVADGDLWLVLDRLSGPGGPVEEWYEVEIYTDASNACSVGVWRDWDD